MGDLAGAVPESPPLVVQRRERQWSEELSSHQAWIQDSELAHPQIYGVERAGPADPKLQTFITQDDSRMTRRSPSEDPVWMMSQ